MAVIVPTVMLILAVFVAAVPWGLPAAATFIPAFLTFLLVFLFSSHRKHPIPAVVVFVAGLMADALTAGPLGYWAIIFLLGHVPARMVMRSRKVAESLTDLWFVFAVATLVAVGVGWTIASVYYLRLIDWWPMALGALVAVAAFPMAAWSMRRSLAFGRYRFIDVRT